MEKKEQFKEFIYITFAMLFISASVYFFLVPSGIVVGSISGLAMVLSQLLSMPMSLITLILNAVLLVVGFLLIGKEFGAKTVYTSFLLPIFLWMFEKMFPFEGSITGNAVFDLAAYILMIALGQAMLFRVNASSGGLDIVTKVISKYTHMEIGKAVTLAGMVTAFTSIFVYDVGTLVVSILGTYANGQAIDYFIDGFNKKKKICILSNDYEVIKEHILNHMKRGVTLYKAQGGYEKTERTELVTIMTVNEYRQLLNYLQTANIEAFVTVSTINEVIGTWNIKRKESR